MPTVILYNNSWKSFYGIKVCFTCDVFSQHSNYLEAPAIVLSHPKKTLSTKKDLTMPKEFYMFLKHNTGYKALYHNKVTVKTTFSSITIAQSKRPCKN